MQCDYGTILLNDKPKFVTDFKQKQEIAQAFSAQSPSTHLLLLNIYFQTQRGIGFLPLGIIAL